MPFGATPTSATGPDAIPPRRQKRAMGSADSGNMAQSCSRRSPGVPLPTSRPSPRSDFLVPGALTPRLGGADGRGVQRGVLSARELEESFIPSRMRSPEGWG